MKIFRSNSQHCVFIITDKNCFTILLTSIEIKANIEYSYDMD